MTDRPCKVSSVPLSSDLVPWIIETWPIKKPVACELWTSGINNIFMLDSADGKRVLRVSRRCVPGQIDPKCETRLLLHLARNGCRVAGPVRTTSGEYVASLQLPEGAVPVVMFEYLPGDEHRPSIEESEEAGRTVAGIHLAAASFPESSSFPEADAGYLVDDSLAVICAHLNLDDQTLERLTRIAAVLRQGMQAMQKESPAWGVIHGDVLPTNVRHVNGPLCSAWYDFEFCRMGWRAYDVASWRSFQFFTGWGGDSAEQSWKAFLHGYIAARPMEAWEERTISIFVAARILFVSGIHAWLADIRGHALFGKLRLVNRLALLEDLVRKL